MTNVDTQTEGERPAEVTTRRLPRITLPRERTSIAHLAVCIFTIWLVVLLLTLLVVVGVYTSKANQIVVVSSMAVISIALVLAACKLNSIAGFHKMVEEDMATKSDPPPNYDDVLHSEPPPPSYYSVVSESSAVGDSTTPAATRNRQEPQAAKVISPPSNRRSPVFRRWLGRPGILQTLVSPSMFRGARGAASDATPNQQVKSKERSLNLRRSSSTPSLTGLSTLPSMARWPSSPSLCDGCGWL